MAEALPNVVSQRFPTSADALCSPCVEFFKGSSVTVKVIALILGVVAPLSVVSWLMFFHLKMSRRDNARDN
jgi:hypothetical protein